MANNHKTTVNVIDHYFHHGLTISTNHELLSDEDSTLIFVGSKNATYGDTKGYN
jgi:hypothetical protein